MIKLAVYKYSSNILLIFLLLISILKVQNTEYISEDLNGAEKVTPCTIDLLSYENSINKNMEVEVINKPISIFPKIENFYCIGTINYINSTYEHVSIETSSSKRFEVALSSLVYFLLFLNKKNINTKNFLIFLFINTFLLSFLFDYYFFTYIGLGWFVLKFFLFYSIYKNEILQKIENVFYFLIAAIGSDLLNNNLTFGELTYFGRALKNNNINSAYIGDSHLYLFNNLIKVSKNLFPENFKILLEFFLCLWLVFLISKYKKLFQLNILTSVLFIFLFLNQQSIISGEWYFGAVEGKVFAYLSLLTSFYYAYVKELNKSCFFYLLSFYFHASVAVVIFPVYFYLQIKKFKFNKLIKSNFISFIFALPLILNLLNYNEFREFTKNNVLTESNKINMIVERVPHHLYPFNRIGEFGLQINNQWKPGFASMLCLTLILLFIKNKKYFQNEILDVAIFSSFIFWMYSFIVFIFPFSQFTLLFPFRIGSIFLIFLYLYICLCIQDYEYKFTNIGITFLITFLLLQSFSNIQNDYYFDELELKNDPKLNIFLDNSNIELLILPLYESSSIKSTLNFIEYETGIPTYVSWKFNAHNIRDISIWRDRIEKVSNFYNKNCKEFKNYGEVFFIDYKKTSPCGELVYELREIYVFKLID